jgi:hypothetical protein
MSWCPPVTPDEVIDPVDPEEDKVDPFVKGLVARDLEKGMGAMMIYARRVSEDPFWPIGLCVAWVRGRDAPEVARLYAQHRLGIGVIPVDGWVNAETSLHFALATGKIGATGVGHEGGRRVSIPAPEWIDLRIQQRGSYDEVRRAEGPIAYLDVRIAAAVMKMEWPAATPATNRARDQQENERACLEALKERMRANPNDPVPKKKLRLEFPEVSGRAFHQTFRQAVREAQCFAWSSAGRRSQKREAN